MNRTNKKNARHSGLVLQTIVVDDLWKWLRFVGENLYQDSTYVFRGQANSKWTIKSSFERKFLDDARKRGVGTFGKPPEMIYEKRLRVKERELIDGFRRDAWHFLGRELKSEVEWISLMRHYGVPTRIVDFTESILVALYFAVGETECKDDFAIWCVNRTLLGDAYEQDYWIEQGAWDFQRGEPNFEQLRSCGRYTIPVEAMRRNEERAEKVLGRDINDSDMEDESLPILYLYPKFRNARMSAQSGLFLMPTRLRMPFNDLLCEDGVQDSRSRVTVSKLMENQCVTTVSGIVKFVFSAKIREDARTLLRMSNITDRQLFPDLAGVAMSVRNHCCS